MVGLDNRNPRKTAWEAWADLWSHEHCASERSPNCLACPCGLTTTAQHATGLAQEPKLCQDAL